MNHSFLSRSERSDLFHLVFNSSQEGLLIADKDGIIVACNPKFCSLFGYLEEEIVGKAVEVLLLSEQREQHRELRELFVKSPEHRPMGRGRELIALHKDEYTFPVEISLSHFTRKGELFISLILSDISYRKKIEDQLNKQKQFNEAVFQTVGALIVVLENDGRIDSLNQTSESILQYKEQEVKGKYFWDLFIRKEDIEESKASLNSLLKNGGQSVFESCWINRAGEEKWISWSNIVFTDKSKDYVIATGIDIGTRKAMEERMLEAVIEGQEAERRRISEDLHDGLGPILSTIRLNIESITDAPDLREGPKDRLSGSVKLIDEAMQELKSISHNLIPNVLRDFGLVQALEDHCNKIGGIGKVRVDFYNFGVDRLSFPREIGMYRIAQEGINNALKYSGAESINVQLVQYDKSVLMMIEDSGSGFDYEKIKNDHSGFGLRNILSRAKSLHGKVEIDTYEGRGTTITIEIPLV